jgi:hypothetical protein
VSQQRAPKWAERTAPKGLTRRDVPSLMLISLPDSDCYEIATMDETDAVADPNSYAGRFLRPHAALLALTDRYSN